MITKKDVGLNKSAVAQALRLPLEVFYKARNAGEYDGNDVRPGNWDENEDLANALSKSKYLAKNFDWWYALQLIFAVLDHHPQLTPANFVDELENLIVATAGERDYLAIFPVGFKPEWSFGLPGMQKTVVKSKAVANFNIAPAAPSLKEFNRIVSKLGYPKINDSDFQHAMRTTNKAFARPMLVTFEVHGSEDLLRRNADFEFTRFRRLVEVFGCLFGGDSSGLAPGIAANHFFLLNKTTGDLRRFATRAPSFVDLSLDETLLKVVGGATFAHFLSQLSSMSDGMYGRLRNAIKFFSMALNADDNVASFLFYVVAMEAIFSRDKNNPIKVTLADLGAMLCFPPDQRLDAHKRIREAYDMRSAIVHNGASSVGREHVEVARTLAARAIYASLCLCRALEKESGKLEDHFFNYLRDQKLGLVKGLQPRELWTLPPLIDNKDD